MRRLQLLRSTTRQTRFIGALLLASMVASLPSAIPSVDAAGSVEYSQNVSNTGDMSEAPSADFNGGRLASIWGERSSEAVDVVGGSLDAALASEGKFNTGTNTQYQWPDLEVDANGTIHITYAAGNTIFYRNKPRGGNWSSAVKVASDNFPNPVRLAVAPNGTIWVVWRDGDGTRIGFRFSNNGGAGWSGGSAGGTVAAESGNMSSPDVAVGPDNVPHVVWYIRSSGDKGDIKYADWDGARFRSGKLTNDGSGLYDADPVITVDGQNVQHVSYRKELSSGGNWGIYYASRSGSGWRDFTTVGTTSGNAGYSSAIGTDPSGSVYITYSTLFGGSRKVVLAARPAGQNWGRQDMSDGPWDTRSAVTGSNSSGQKAHVFYQTENRGRDDGEIIYNRVRFSGVVVNADPTLDANSAFTRNTSVTVTFSAVQGNPTEMRWRWGAAPTDQQSDSNGWQPFQNPRQISLPVPESGCGPLTLYTQVKAGNNVQQNAQYDSIIYDASVEATVGVLNPRNSRLTSSYSEGANAGAGGYTRETAYTFVLNGTDDCGGLKSYKINTGPETAITGGGANVNNLPFGAQASGVKTVDVVVTDKAGNQQTYNRSIQLDLAADGKPVVQGATVRIDGGNSLQQTITITDARVNDNLYGPAEGLPANKEFWGVFVATSRTPIDANQINATAGLRWTPIRVQNPAAGTFTVNYNVTSGLGVNGLSGAEGTYYVYLKFIDGAGNPSEWTSNALQVTLSQGYSVPSAPLPTISK